MAFNFNDISKDLLEIKKKEYLEQKRRQRLRENCQELKDIEKHLKTAYFVQQLKIQQNELETRKKNEQIQREKEALEIEFKKKENERLRIQEENKEQQMKNKFRNLLKDQISDSLARRQERIEEMTRDREHTDRLLERLKVEQQNEKKELEERRLNTKQELKDFMRQQKMYKQKEREIDEEAKRRADEIQRQRDAEKKHLADLKRLHRLQQESLSEKIGLDLHKKELEKRHRESLMLELLEDERKAKEEYIFKENLKRQIRERELVRLELEKYIETRKNEREMKKRNKLNTERAEMERLITENEMITAEEVKKMKEKVESYNQEIQKMLKERQDQRKLTLSDNLRDFELLQSEEKKIQREIEEERIRILGNHSTEILYNLPAGVLKDSDREFFALPPQK